MFPGSGCGGLVGEDDGAGGTDACGGKRVVARQHLRQDVALPGAADEEGDERLRVQVGEREREPRMRRRHPGLGDVDDRPGVGELLLVPGVQRGRVAVGADAEQHEVEGFRERDARRAQRVDLLLRDGNAPQQRLAGQPLVRVPVLGRDEPLVAPPDVPRAPVELEPGEMLVGRARRRPAGEGDAERASRPGALGEPAGREPG